MSFGSLSGQPIADPLDVIQGYAVPIQGSFTQQKFFKVLKKPIRSSGSFVITKESLEWRTVNPVHSAVLLLNDQLWLENSRGERTLQPNAQSVAVILRAVLTGDKPEIKKYFNATSSEQQMCITLMPELEQMKAIVERLLICPLAMGYRITMIDSNDVKTDIEISIEQHSAGRES